MIQGYITVTSLWSHIMLYCLDGLAWLIVGLSGHT